jgi:hypothetical protein
VLSGLGDGMAQAVKYICITVLLLGGLLFLSTWEFCSSCTICNDTFERMENVKVEYRTYCPNGSSVEIVEKPVPGILCHCNRKK